MQLISVSHRSRALSAAVLVAAFLAFPALPWTRTVSAATATDPSDAPTGPAGKTDLRSLTWDIGATTATVTIAIDESTYDVGKRAEIGLHVLLDTDRNGIADAQVIGTRNADGAKVDLQLRSLSGINSTGTCQELGGSPLSYSIAVTSSIANSRETFSFSFNADAVPAGFGNFLWVAFGQSPPDGASAGPWDYVPDAANPNPTASNPGDRRCGASNEGLRVDMVRGITQAPHRPDGRIRLGTGSYIGNNVYNTTAAGQSKTGSAAPQNKVSFTISIQNDGANAAKFDVHATGVAAGYYVVKYLRNGSDITAAVAAGTYQTTSLAPGATFLIVAKVTVKASATAGSQVVRLVTISSLDAVPLQDTVKFTAKRS